MKKLRTLGLAFLAISCLGSCALIKTASKLQTVLASEEDPELAADALPTFIMVAAALHEADPGDQGKAVTLGSLYVMYANAFVQGPASALPDERFEERKAAFDRAGALYRRAFGLFSGCLERRARGVVGAAVNGKADLSAFKKADVPLLYWSAVSILAGFGLNPLDFKSAHYLAAAPLFLARAAELDPAWNSGAIYGIYVNYYAGMPDYLGGSLAKAEECYAKAVEYSKGGSASLLVTYATAICVPKEDLAGFKESLQKAIAIDPDAHPESRLETVLAQRSARRLLAETDKYFTTNESEKP